MARVNSFEKENGNLGIGKVLLIVMMVFILVPLSIAGILYLFNENFQFIANNYLSNIPGVIGQYFDRFPTREEREQQKREVINYLMGLDIQSAADKLTIIKKSDEKLYLDLIQLMTQMNRSQANKIMERIREISIKKDILASTIDQIRHDQLNEIKEYAQYFEKMSLKNAIAEIKNNLLNEKISYKQLSLIMKQMKEDTAAKILNNLDEDLTKKILFHFESEDKKSNIEITLNKMKDKEETLINIAAIYNVEDAPKILQDIVNDKKYKLDELSILFRNMKITQTAEVLAKMEDENYMYSLLQLMKDDEILAKGKDELTPKIIEAMRIYREYDEKVNELVLITSKMEVQQISDMITKLFNSNQAPQKYIFDENNSIIISDQDIAVSILEKLQPKTVAEILSSMDTDLASEISKKLALP